MPAAVETMAYNKVEVPWHGLGVPVEDDLSAHDMMVAAGLDWEVGKYVTYARVKDKTVPTGKKALIRLSDNRVLSPLVGPDWEPTQNEEAFEFFKEYVDAGDMSMETAGSLKGGQIVWALARMKGGFTINGDDETLPYLLFSNSHEYGTSTQADFTATRVVCMNTLQLALGHRTKNRVVLNHRAKFDPEKVKEMLGLAANTLDEYKEKAEFLSSKKATEFDIVEYFKELFPVGANAKKEMSKLAIEAIETVHAQPGANLAEGTWWQPFNAVTFMADHTMSRTDDTRVYNAWFGGTRDLKTKALKKALEYAAAA